MEHALPNRPSITLILIAALLLLAPALYNGFPLVTSDSGAYIANGFELSVPLDRPLGYSIFIRLCSLGATLWGVVACQAIILAFFLHRICRHLLGPHYRQGIFIAIMLIVTAATSAAWFTGQLMPDIFTAILFLAVFAWFFTPFQRWWQQFLLLLFIYAVLLQHNSNALILLSFSIILLGYRLVRRGGKLRPPLLLIGLSLASLLTFSAMNAIAGKGFRPSAGTHVFLMCRLVESGIMDKFLEEQCGSNKYKMCAYKDQLPNRQWDFMWDQNGALYKTGGWEANEAEYSSIERRILTTPKYLILFIFKSVQATLRQLPQIYIGDGLTQMGPGSSPYNNIQHYHRHELKEYSASLQQTSGLPFSLFNGVIIVASYLLGAMTLFIRRREGRDRWASIFRMVFLFLICNAAVTATFSTVLGRFQARVFWLLPFFCLIYLVKIVAGRFNKYSL